MAVCGNIDLAATLAFGFGLVLFLGVLHVSCHRNVILFWPQHMDIAALYLVYYRYHKYNSTTLALFTSMACASVYLFHLTLAWFQLSLRSGMRFKCLKAWA